MLSVTKRLQRLPRWLGSTGNQLRYARTDSGPLRRRSKSSALSLKKTDEKSEWWVVDGEMHEIGDNVPPRERFVIPRDNIPNRRRKQLREQFMRRTRLVLKESVSLRYYASLSSLGFLFLFGQRESVRNGNLRDISVIVWGFVVRYFISLVTIWLVRFLRL